MNQFDIAGVDLNLLKIFEALFEEGGASRAAIRLDMTQSAVSAALRRLRALYADTLFVRTGRGLAPTSRAQELKPVISEALDRCRHSLAIASPDATTFHGRAVSIGLSDDFEVAIGRPGLAEVPFERSALAIAENVGIPVAAGKAQAFEQTIARLADDLTGNNPNTAVRSSLWQRLMSRA